jgi:hypothetical protein
LARKYSQRYVVAPDDFRIELVEDSSLQTSVVSHHLHYFVAEPAAVKQWYTANLLVTPAMRGRAGIKRGSELDARAETRVC